MRLYHIHRMDRNNPLWVPGNEIIIDDSYNTFFYEELLKEDEKLRKRYNDYDIDFIICMMEEIKLRNIISENNMDDYQKLLDRYYFLRRELALEYGRKEFNHNAPSRLHSLYLTNKRDLPFWKNIFENTNYQVFKLELDGNIFETSDTLFPHRDLAYDIQILESNIYWNPSYIYGEREYLFQGKAKILEIVKD